MPLEPFLKAPRSISRLLSRRGMLHAGLLPLLGLRGAAGKRIPASSEPRAAALPLEGTEPGQHGLAISPDGSTAYVSFRSSDPVLVVDLKAGRVRSAIDLSAAGVMLMSNQAVLSADGKLLFVANQGVDKVTVIDTGQERVRKVLPLSVAYYDCIKASPKGRVYIGLMDGRLATVSCDDLSYTTMTVKGVTFDSIALSAERANILYSVGQNLFHSVNLDTGVEERRAVLPAAACAPDGGVWRLLLAPSGEVAYLGWIDTYNGGGFGNLTVFDLRAYRAGVPTVIQDGVSDFDVHPQTGKVYAVGFWGGPMEGRVRGMYISEWDPATQKVTRRIPIALSNFIASIQLDPTNPRFAYSTESAFDYLRKVDLLTGAEVMRVRFFPGTRIASAATAAGSLAYIGCLQAPLIHKLDLNSGKLVGTLNLPADWSGTAECAYFQGKLYLWSGGPITVVSAAVGSLILSREVPDGLCLSRMTFFQGKIAAAAYLPPAGDIDRILIFDARTLDVVNTLKLEFPLYGRVGCAVASPDGSKLYVQQGISLRWAVLQVLDSATLRVRKRIEPPTFSSQGGDGDFGDFDEDKRIAYLGGFNSVYKVHMDTDEFLGMLNIYDVYKEMGRPIGWPTSALRGVHLSAAKDRLLIISWDGHSVFQYDLRKEK